MGLTKIEIGDRVVDTIDGFEGIVTGVTEYMNGCRQALVSPEKLTADGNSINGIWTDEQRLRITDKGVRANPFANGEPATAGGPRSTQRATR